MRSSIFSELEGISSFQELKKTFENCETKVSKVSEKTRNDFEENYSL